MRRELKFIILVCLAALPRTCFAAVSLSVDPVDGGTSLRFEKTSLPGDETEQQIHVRVNSTGGGHYQVFERLMEPLMDEKGTNLNPQAIQAQSLFNSNSEGTLYLQNPDHLGMSDQLVYSSGQSGDSDSFIIGYTVDRHFINTSGNFRGRLVFTVRGVGNGSNDESSVDVFLDATSSFKVSIQGNHNPKSLHVRSSDISEKTADAIEISFSGNEGQEVRIYQQVDSAPRNPMDQELGRNVLQLDAQGQGGDSQGLHLEPLSPLMTGRSLVYSSNKDSDNVIIYFLVDSNAVQQQDSGSYFGKIKYVVETDNSSQEFPVDIQTDIAPIFTMNITTPTGGGVNFTHVLANSPPQDQEVLVTVSSNLHRPYQVIQDILTNMTNQQGKEFDSKYFTIRVEIPPGQRGQSDFTDYSPVVPGDYPVFSSDASGSGATFKVLYRIQGYAQMNPGEFLAPVRFSLNQK